MTEYDREYSKFIEGFEFAVGETVERLVDKFTEQHAEAPPKLDRAEIIDLVYEVGEYSSEPPEEFYDWFDVPGSDFYSSAGPE